MPIADRDERKAYMRGWMADRRTEWLAEHPCGCGRPGVRLLAADGRQLPKGVWSRTPEARDVALGECGAEAYCDRCADMAVRRRLLARRSDEERLERQRASNRAYMARRRAELKAAADEEKAAAEAAAPVSSVPAPTVDRAPRRRAQVAPEPPEVVDAAESAPEPSVAPVVSRRRGGPTRAEERRSAALEQQDAARRRRERSAWRAERRARLGYGQTDDERTRST